MNELLKWDVFVTPGIPVVISDPPPGTKQRILVADIVDPHLRQAGRRSGRRLHHRRADPCARGLGRGRGQEPDDGLRYSRPWRPFLRRQHSSRAISARGLCCHAGCSQDYAPAGIATAPRVVLESVFPGQISAHLVIADELIENVIELEGHDLIAVPLGHTDTDNTTCLHVPSIGLVVAGDAAYNGVHVYLAESDPQRRSEWISALDKIESLNPRAVIAGHKRRGNDDSPKIIEETRQYIRDFDRIVGTTTTARELYDKMLELYPDRVNPVALWFSARAVKPKLVQAKGVF